MTDIYIATEDALSESVVARLINDENHGINISIRLRKNGKGYLKNKFSSLVKLASHIPVLLLVDLDNIECPATLISSWKKSINLPHRMFFRVATREIESWLLADRKGFAKFAGAPISQVPPNPGSLLDPKNTLINIIRRYGARDIKEDIVPDERSTAKQGMQYNERLFDFVQNVWSPVRAAKSSDSLYRMRTQIHRLRIQEAKLNNL